MFLEYTVILLKAEAEILEDKREHLFFENKLHSECVTSCHLSDREPRNICHSFVVYIWVI